MPGYLSIIRILCLLGFLFISGQMLPAQQDTDPDIASWIEKANHFLEKGQADSTLYYARKGLEWSENNKAREHTVSCLHLIAKASYQKKNIPVALRYYLQTLKLKENFASKQELINLHFELAELYESWSVYGKAIIHYKYALNYNGEKDPKVEERALLGVAKNERANSNLDAALDYYDILNSLYYNLSDTIGRVENFRSIIEVNKERGNYAQALNDNLNVLSLNESLKDTTEIIVSLNNLGVLYRQLNDLENALKYFLRSVELESQYNPTKSANATTLTNIGILYQNQRNFQLSLQYLFEAKKSIKSGVPIDFRALANISNLISIVYLSKNDMNNAFVHNQEAISLARTIKDKDLEQLCYKTTSSIYEQFNDFEQALAFFQKHASIKDSLQQIQQALREANLVKQFSAEQTEKEMSLLIIDKEVEDLKFQQDLLENERLRQQQDLQNALLAREKLEREQAEQALLIARQELEREKAEQELTQTQQQLLAEQKDRQIASLENEQTQQALQIAEQRLEAEQKDREIAQSAREQMELQLTVDRKDFELENQRLTLLRNFMIGFLLLTLVILGLIYRTSRIRRKANDILESRKQEVETTLADLKHTQSQLVQSEKMASLGQLTAGIAHEINNPVNFVKGNAAALRRDFEDLKPILENIIQLGDEDKREEVLQAILKDQEELDMKFLIVEVQRLLEGIHRGSQRLKDIVSGMRTFSADQGDQYIPADLHEGLDSTLTILQNRLKNSIEIHKDYGGIPLVRCQFGKINQVFLNILANAIDAVLEQTGNKREGHIYIKTRKSGEQVHISIRDNGIGMDEATLNRIYEPFFTTKEVGKGTGLGMAISYGIIENHGGSIEIDSRPGEGTAFLITLPIEASEPESIKQNEK